MSISRPEDIQATVALGDRGVSRTPPQQSALGVQALTSAFVTVWLHLVTNGEPCLEQTCKAYNGSWAFNVMPKMVQKSLKFKTPPV